MWILVNILRANSLPKAGESFLVHKSTMLHMTFPLSLINKPLCAGPQTPLGPNSATAREKRRRRHGNAYNCLIQSKMCVCMSYREENDRIANEKTKDAAVVYFRVLNGQRLREKLWTMKVT